ncbi:TetR family transcriptional regulator C-terminal domain-containing protein [Streptomyces diacarni]|uniref:TetR/AcrR family transcriptional regulator n=1 Tax=Streptomyces diacarni TaxID=2800381 RepID=UPI0033FCFABE
MNARDDDSAALSRAPARLTRKGQATRARIVDAAARLMIETNVAGTRTDDVREAAGVSASQIYHYFEDKPALVRAVISHATDLVLEAQQPVLGQLDSMAALRAWRDHVVELQRSRQCAGGCPLGSLAGELAESGDSARGELAAGFARWETALHEGLTTMHERGELRPDADPQELALALLAALQGGILLTQLRRDTAPMRAALDTTLDRIESLTTDPGPRTVEAAHKR